ncbi:hypothetical protein WR25_15015 [Diploscapter pachys]|uniref:Small RNA 2'-O-methyltransferase n=1 Tax=Diploscapter pachys TaxID=2018661 RepID=A0A2A2JAM5_9BILA|nr:hypothetical protein WR25_15015 [Diploscapter pachys]
MALPPWKPERNYNYQENLMKNLKEAYEEIDAKVHRELDVDLEEMLKNISLVHSWLNLDDKENNKRLFTPPLQRQRADFVRDILLQWGRAYNIKKLAVMGCGQLYLEWVLMYKMDELGLRCVCSVDKKASSIREGIKDNKYNYNRVMSVLQKRVAMPCVIEAYLGSILELDGRVADADAVVSTEVIEHMPIEDATKFCLMVLTQIQPKMFVVSTPNAEYNTAFGLELGKFRHTDHKFEFDRQQFQDWIDELMEEVGELYEYEIRFVGQTDGYEELQGATQFVIFRFTDIYSAPKSEELLNMRNYKLAGHYVIYHGLRHFEFHTVLSAIIQYIHCNYDEIRMQSENVSSSLIVVPCEAVLKLCNFPALLLEQNKINIYQTFRWKSELMWGLVGVTRICADMYFVMSRADSVEETIHMLTTIQQRFSF